MSRHCLYCAKELPKGSTNNFCSKECWTEYKKLKAMDVGTDKQATVLLKRSELAEASEQDGTEGFAESFAAADSYPVSADGDEPEAPPARSDGIFEDVASSARSPFEAAGAVPRKASTESTSISERLTNLEILLNEKLGQAGGDAKGLLTEITRRLDEMNTRQSKLEMDMEKADTFLRTVDKFEDRLRRLEREIQSVKSSTDTVRPKGFFARLFS
ncbi:MAG TPA: hypothetical protein PLV45_06805 [bacterium]|nr:hypothetical protein [bacterium]